MMFNKRRRLLHSSRVKLSLVRHYLKTAGRGEIAEIEQMEKTVPLITWEIALCQYVCELVFGVIMFDLDFGIEVDSVKQPIRRDSVVLATCLIIGLLSLMIILITASLSSKCTTALHIEQNLRLWSRDLDLTTDQHTGYISLSTSY